MISEEERLQMVSEFVQILRDSFRTNTVGGICITAEFWARAYLGTLNNEDLQILLNKAKLAFGGD